MEEGFDLLKSAFKVANFPDEKMACILSMAEILVYIFFLFCFFAVSHFFRDYFPLTLYF